MFSCAPLSIENSVLMLPCAAHEQQQVQERDVVEVTGEQPAHRHLEQVATDRRADARVLEVPGERLLVPLGRASSASTARRAAACFASRSIRSWAQAIVPTASGLIFGMRPV